MKHFLSLFLRDTQNKIALVLCFLTLLSSGVLFVLYGESNSIALLAYGSIGSFSFFSLIGAMLSRFLSSQSCSSKFVFGYDRVEVMSIFSSGVISLVISLFIVKEALEMVFLPPYVHTQNVLLGVSVTFVTQLCLIYAVPNRALNDVITASSTSWLQEYMADISHSLCRLIPGLSSVLLPRANPLCLLSFCGAAAVLTSYFLVQISNNLLIDIVCAVCVCIMSWITLLPISYYTGRVLLQSTPAHVVGQLDKCLREALTLDGVLEFRNEHFWTVGFGTMAGSLHVRVRRDANEQVVLSHVFDRMSGIVQYLTVQVFKDEWTRSHTTIQLLNDSAIALNLPQPTPTLYYPRPQQTSAVNGTITDSKRYTALAKDVPASLYNASTLVPKRYYPPNVKSSPERINPFLKSQANGNHPS